jgi:hypothetical protein
MGIGKAVPSPSAQDANRHRLFVIFREALCPGNIEIKGEFTVAHGHGPHGVDGVNYDVMAADQGVPVDGLLGAGGSAGKARRAAARAKTA